MARYDRLIPLRSMPRTHPCPRCSIPGMDWLARIAQTEEGAYFKDECYYFCEFCRLGFSLSRVQLAWQGKALT